MSQISFSDAEYAGKRKKTRREVFLEEMEQVVPWKALLKVIEPHYPVAGRGRRPYPLEAMLRVHLMQNWFALSDPAMEEALYEIASLRNFAGLKRRPGSKRRSFGAPGQRPRSWSQGPSMKTRFAELKAELLSDLCGSNALVSFDRLLVAEINSLADRSGPPVDMFDAHGRWFPEIPVDTVPQQPWQKMRVLAEEDTEGRS